MRIRIVACRNLIKDCITYHVERRVKFWRWSYWTFVPGSLKATPEEAEEAARRELAMERLPAPVEKDI